MPIYEYKCPNGHLFEVFHGMTEPGPETCEVCGASPLVSLAGWNVPATVVGGLVQFTLSTKAGRPADWAVSGQ